MATQVQRRKGTTAQHSTFTGAQAELTVDTDKNTVVVHDGATAGGFPLARDSAVVHLTGNETIAGTKTLSSNPILNAGTANGLAFLNASKVLTTGSALTFDGTNFAVGTSLSARFSVDQSSAATVAQMRRSGVANIVVGNSGNSENYYDANTQIWRLGDGSEAMRLTSTGLGIGTSSPGYKLHVEQATTSPIFKLAYNSTYYATMDYLGSINTVTTASSDLWQLKRNGTAQVSLDGAGNLGLGVTPSASASADCKQIAIGGLNYLSGTNGTSGKQNFSTGLYYNAYQTGIGSFNAIVSNSGGDYLPAAYVQLQGQHRWLNASSATAGNAISFTQAMTLDASGNLGVGVTSVTAPGASRQGIQVASAQGGAVLLGQSATATNNARVIGANSGAELLLAGGAGNPVTIYTDGTERARIDSSGNLLVGTTSVPSASVGGAGFVPASVGRTLLKLATTTTGGAGLVEFYNPNGMVGEISVNGSATTYSTSSDYRLKNTIAPMTGALAKVALLKPVTYKWNADGSDGEGFIAHELAEVVPQCVTGEKDAVDANGNPVYQGIDTSFLVATLTAAIQELKAEFDAYKASHP